LAQTEVKGKKRHILTVLRIVVAAGALYLAFRNQDLGQLSRQLMKLNPLVFAAAVGLFLFAQVLFVMRWRLLLRVLSIHIGLGVGMKLHFLGWFYNNCLPSSVGGDLLRAWYVTGHVEPNKRTEAALSVFFDRAIGLAGMLLMATGCYLFIPVEGQFGGREPEISSKIGALEHVGENWLVLVVAVAMIIAGFAGFAANERGRGLLVRVWGKFWGIAAKGIAAVKLYSRSPLTIISTIGLTVILQGISITGFSLLGRNLGMDIPIKYYFVFFPVSWLIGTIPISIGGLGVMEGSVSYMFRAVGASGENASAIAICQRLIWWVCALPGIVIHLFGAHLPANKREFFVDSDGNAD
jgi:glycosyltransferase 2 family protein